MASKPTVNYRRSDSTAEACGKCDHGEFMGSSSTGTCEVVAGKIDSRFVCDKFEAKESEKSAPSKKGAPPFAKKQEAGDAEA